jgi:PAS domain S-box-containing protein
MKNKIIHSAHTFEILLESAHDAMIIVNAEGQIVLVNNQVEKLFGYESNELTGQSIEVLMPAKHKETHPGLRTTYFSAPEVRAMGKGRELLAQKKDGSQFPVEIGLSPLETISGTMVLAAIVDISYRKMVEKNSLEQAIDNKFKAIVEHTLDALTMRDAEGKLMYLSPGFTKILGYTFDEIKEMDVALLLHPEDVSDLSKRIAQAKANPGVPVYGRNQMRHNGGHYIWVEGTITNLLEDEHVKALVGNFRDITESVIAQEKLKETEKRFQALVQSNDEPIVMLDSTGNVTYVSPATERLMGYSFDEFMGKDGSLFFHPDEMEVVYQRMEESIKNPGKPIFKQNRVKHKEGHYIWTEGTTTNYLALDHVKAFVVNFRDITVRKNYEESLLKANRLYSFLSYINKTIVHATSEQIVFAEACRIAIELGKFRGAWIGTIDPENKAIRMVAGNGILPEIVLSSDETPIEQLPSINHILATGSFYISNDSKSNSDYEQYQQIVLSHEFRSGMVLPIWKSGNLYAAFFVYGQEVNFFGKDEIELLEEAAGDISFALSVFEKEKHKREVEQRLVHSEKHLIQAQAIAHIGSWDKDIKTGVTTWSEEACRIFGLSADDNQRPFESVVCFLHPDDREFIIEQIKESRLNDSDCEFHYRIVLNNNSIKYIYAKNHHVKNAAGVVIRRYGIVHDETEIKEAENEKMKMMKDILERNKDLEQFSYIISHNLRAPVANIMGLTELIKINKLGLQEGEAELIGHLSDSVRKMDEVIMDLNNILQIGKDINEQKEKILLSEIVQKVISDFSESIYELDVVIEVDFSAIDELFTFKSYIYSIYYNLISNSIKYRQPGMQPVIQISSTKTVDKMQIVFRDNGMGIDLEKKKDQVFGLYKRFHTFIEGRGIGLFMVRTQVQSLGGTISIDSEVNKGTTFRIIFDL